MAGQSARVFLVGKEDDLVGDLAGRLLPDHPTTLISSTADIAGIWDHSDGVVLMIDSLEEPLSAYMPEIARQALARGFRVIRLARDTGGLPGIWDSRVLHLPRGVRQKVLLSALVGLSAIEAEA